MFIVFSFQKLQNETIFILINSCVIILEQLNRLYPVLGFLKFQLSLECFCKLINVSSIIYLGSVLVCFTVAWKNSLVKRSWCEERIYLSSTCMSQSIPEDDMSGTQAGPGTVTTEKTSYWLIPRIDHSSCSFSIHIQFRTLSSWIMTSTEEWATPLPQQHAHNQSDPSNFLMETSPLRWI